MPNVTTPLPDFKVFFRRLLIPGELSADPNATLTASQIAGSSHSAVQSQTVQQQIAAAFGSYQPSQFKGAVISKASTIAAQYASSLSAATSSVASIKKQIGMLQSQLAAVSGATTSGVTVNSDQLNNLSVDAAYYATTTSDAETYAASQHGPTDPTPLARDNTRFLATLSNLNSISESLGNTTFSAATIASGEVLLPNGNAVVADAVSNLTVTLNALISGAYVPSSSTAVTLTPVVEDDFRASLVDQLSGIIALVGTSSGNQATVNSLNSQIGVLTGQLADAASNLLVLKKSSAIQPFYEPILLDCMIGPYSATTSMNRMGQPGTGSVTFHLPLVANGQVPNLFFGMQVTDVFNLTSLESQTTAASAAAHGAAIPAQTLSILTPNMRECVLQPFDMMQVWARKRYSITSNFPGDYYPIFTGFVTKTTVSYSGSAVAVKVDGEDVGKMVRLARIDADPSLDQSLNALGLGISSYTNSVVAQSANGQTGGQMIKNIIGGKSGSFLGMSNASFITTAAYAGSGATQTLVTTSASASAKSATSPVATNQPGPVSTNLSTSIVNLAWDFQNILVNVFDDLVNNWPPYATQLKSAFRTWQTDELTKWEVCSQIAETQEFEFYADNMGVVNYHPPLYYLNPFAPQYYIEDIDIISESHSTDEKEVVTVMELDTQPSLFANGSVPNPILQGRAFVSAATPIMQRYAVRYAKKSAPIFSDTQVPNKSGPKQSGDPTYSSESGRTGYARALLNRRNARLKSASVTINGTPELRLCNTVAFVGNLGTALQSVSLNPFAPSAPGVSLPAVGQIVQSLSTQNSTISASTLTALQQMLVYYISGIVHNYTQGKDFTTTLMLTHGRHWTEALPSGSVGYGVSGPQTDATYQSMLAFYGQGNPTTNISNFVSVASAKLNFLATGNPAALNPATNSQFGFTAQPVKPSALKKFETQLSTAVNTALVKLRAAICNPLSSENDPKHVVQAIKEENANIINAIEKGLTDAENSIKKQWDNVVSLFKNAVGKGEKMLTTYENKLESALKEKALQLEEDLNNPEALAFQAELGNKSFKIIKSESFSSGKLLKLSGASTYLAPLSSLGIDTSKITSANFGIAAYIYAAQSPTSVSDAQNKSATQVIANAKTLLNTKGVPKKMAQVVITSTTAMKHSSSSLIPVLPPPPPLSSVLSSSPAPAATATATSPAPQQVYYVLGLMIVGIVPTC